MNLVLAITGATGAYAAEMLIERSPWPISLVVSQWGEDVCRHEGVSLDRIADAAQNVFDDKDLAAAISSGSTPSVGMVVLPCSTNTLAKIAGGIADSLITRAAHCHLKEHRKLVLCIRESPWTLIDLDNAKKVASAGGIIMPLSPPFYMAEGDRPETVTMSELLGSFADRVLAVLGSPAASNWENIS